ncbi:MAG: S8 family serine peptidase [Promethearchaeota archaeon]
MSERWKFNTAYLDYLTKRESDKSKLLESFLIFKDKKNLSSFLEDYSVKNTTNEENGDNRDLNENAKIIKYKEKTAEIKYKYSIVPALFIESTVDFLVSIETDTRINTIDGNYRAYLSLDEINKIVGTEIIRNSFYRPAGRGVKVAILDTGIDTNHPDLLKRVIVNYNLTEEEEEDLCGHGTMMAGIICGTGFVSRIKFRGVAPAVKLIDVKIADKTGIAYISDLLKGLEAIKHEKPDIIFFGLNTPIATDDSSILARACNILARDSILVAPAGNFGPDPMMIGPPASASGVFCVGTVDKKEKMTFFSSRGPNFDGRIKPDLVIPGTQVVTTRGLNSELGTIYEFNRSYCKISGTSVSAAIFTGIVAMLKEVRPKLNTYIIRRALRKTSNSLSYSQSSQGYGVPATLQFFKALESYLPKPMSYPALLEKAIVFSFGALVFALIFFYLFRFMFTI